jgi:hypothetical protein
MNLSKSIIALALGFTAAVPAMTMPGGHAEAGVAIGVSIGIAPPPLPVYIQPPIPAPGYLWTPGYWGYGVAGYYWVPGVWVRPPAVGLLWTPGYWGFVGGAYTWHAGYWGPHVGFYGGVNYGFGYGGIGFVGGTWRGGAFAYNSAVTNIGNTHITNVYNDTRIVNQNTVANTSRASFNGAGGVSRAASAEEQRFAAERHTNATANQLEHETAASRDRGQLASANRGTPATLAAADHNAYRATAEQHEKTQPITAADRAAGRANPNGREANQDQRIANGLKTGQMTSGEAARAERTQSKIDRQVHNDRAANGGRLTAQERQHINNEQNQASRQIYNENHNGRSIAPNAVDNREANQQQRTANGLRSGRETSGEAARANRRQAGAAQEVHNDRAANGGALNKQQRQRVNRQMNRDSGQIYRQKHNGKEA